MVWNPAGKGIVMEGWVLGKGHCRDLCGVCAAVLMLAEVGDAAGLAVPRREGG